MLTDGLQIIGSATIDNLNVQSGTSLPASGNNTGELFYLTAGSVGLYAYDGSQWKIVGGDSLPSQTGNSGKFLTTDGTTASWSAIPATAASALTGTTLASNVVSSSLTSVGTITSGTWSGSFGAVSGANLTSLNASNLSTGTVGTARLGTGTANSTSYLRGDGTWSAIPATAASALTGTTLASNVVSSSLTSLGTIATLHVGSGGLTTATETTALNISPLGAGSNPGAHVNITGGNVSAGGGAGGNVVITSGSSWNNVSGDIVIVTGATDMSGGGTSTERLRVASTGEWKLAGSAGTAGQALVSNGAGSAPTWQTITAAADASTLTGTTLASNVVSSSLTSVGTITSGTWSGSFGAVSGANLTSLNASNLSSGTVPTARLGSGTASSTTYLRGDGTWSTISAGSTTLSATGSVSVPSAAGIYAGRGLGANQFPVIYFYGGTTTDNKISQLYHRNDATGTISWDLVNDAASVNTTFFNVTRSGTTASNITFTGTAITLTGAVTGTSFSGSGSGLTSLNASNLSTGTVGTARLGTGTADSSTYLRGDGTWSAPSVTALTGTGSSTTTSATSGLYAGLAGGQASVNYVVSTGATNGKIWRTGISGTTVLRHAVVNDANNSETAYMDITRSGQTVSDITFTSTTITSVGRLDLKTYTETKTAPTFSATQAIDCSTGTVFQITLGGNITSFSLSNVPATGKAYTMTLFLTQDATGSRTVTWTGFTGVKWPSGAAPTLTTTANKTDIITMTTFDGGTTWYGFTGGLNY